MKDTALLPLVLGLLLIGSSFRAWTAEPPPPGKLGIPQVYKSRDGRDLSIHILTPQGWSPQDKRPAIVLFHGGGWTKGTPSVLKRQADFCASLGMVAFLVEYRLAPDNTQPPEPCIRDAKSAMRWVRAHAGEWGVDPDRIAAGGGSAGAHLAAATALLPGFDEEDENLTISPKPQALILFNPVINNGPGGYAYSRVKDCYKDFSPAHNITPGAPPTLIMSGTVDKVVPVSILENYQKAMIKAGNLCELELYEGGDHGFYMTSHHEGKFHAPTLARMETFFRSLGWLPTP